MIQPSLLRPVGLLSTGFLVAVVTAPLWGDHSLVVAAAAGLVAAGALAALLRTDRNTADTDASDPAAGPREPVLDLSALAALQALGDETFVREVAGQFEAEGRLLMLRIARAVAARDAADFAAQTHALRSSAANVGARRLFTLCLGWRELSTQQLAAGGAARLDALQREFDAATHALRAALPAPGAPAAGPAMAKAASAR